jgi:hypothetical protein
MLACPVAERLTAQQIHHGDDDCLVVGRGMIEKFLQCVSDDLIGSIARIGQGGSTRPGCTAGMVHPRPPERQARKAFVEKSPTLLPVRSKSPPQPGRARRRARPGGGELWRSVPPALAGNLAPHGEGAGQHRLRVGHVASSNVVVRIDRISSATRSHGSRYRRWFIRSPDARASSGGVATASESGSRSQSSGAPGRRLSTVG